MRHSVPRVKWLMEDGYPLPDGAYSLEVPSAHLRSFLREYGTRLWFIPAHLPKDPGQVLVSVEEEIGVTWLGVCRRPWVVIDAEVLPVARERECATFYVFNREDLVAYTDAPLF